MIQKQIYFNGKDSKPFKLREGESRLIFKFKSEIDPLHFLKQTKGFIDYESKINLHSSFPDSRAHVFEINGKADLRDEIKTLIRSNNHEALEYVGSLFEFDHSGVYQIYTGNIYIEFESGISPSAVRQFFEKYGLVLKEKLEFVSNAYFCETQNHHNRKIFDFANDLLVKPGVLCCHPELVTDLTRNLESKFQDVSSSTLPFDWWTKKIELTEAWKTTKGGDVIIAVLDDGLDPTHKAFKNKIISPIDMMDKNYTRFPDHQYGQKHGTPCSSIATSNDARALGVAPNAKLMPIRIGGLGSVLQSKAIYLAVQNGADVISCSWGPPDGNILDPNDNENYFPLPDHTKRAFQYAIKHGRNGKGTPIVFAAGNGKEPVKYDGYASAPEVIAVGASNYRDEATIYSDYGFPIDCCFPSGDFGFDNNENEINQTGILVADRSGSKGYSRDNYYSIFTGTSASCPGVAGVIALMIAVNPNISYDHIRASFRHICNKIGDKKGYDKNGYHGSYGYGLISAKKAIAYSKNLNSKPIKNRTMNDLKTKAVSLHIGINYVDDSYYFGQVPPLDGCVNDMENMKSLAKSIGYKTKSLKNKQATIENIKDNIIECGNSVEEGGIFLISYAGHGARIENENEDMDDENDFMDESWVSYDGFLLDDEIYNALAMIERNIRVVLISDSCHSESMTRMADFSGYKQRQISTEAVKRILERNGKRAADLRSVVSGKRNFAKVSVINLSACLQHETAKEINGQGVFSKILKEVYNDFADDPTFNYKELINEVKDRVLSEVDQEPNYSLSHQGSDELLNEFPFSIDNEMGQNKIKTANVVSNSLANTSKLSASTDELMIIENGGTRKERSDSMDRTISNSAWDNAYDYALENFNEELEHVEPNILSNLYFDGDNEAERGGKETDTYLPTYPPYLRKNKDVDFIWHLRKQFTGLKEANEQVFPEIKKGKQKIRRKSIVRIAHIDTGILDNHPSKPQNIVGEKTFKLSKSEKKAIDKDKTWSLGERQGHGHATVSLLAGGWVDKEDTENRYHGYFGAIPFAEIITIKISESVVLLSGRNFAKAVDYAISKKCDVITMSMAGLPSKIMAQAVDRAYEKGIVIVSAAGNCWSRGLGVIAPKKSLYPARYDRVIAAVGTTYEKVPYLNKIPKLRAAGGKYMQSCYGPSRVLKSSVAAFTPNVTWFSEVEENKFYTRDGGGTSSATPQIAAAAALYIQKHKAQLKKYKGTWRHAEIVRNAIFASANKSSAYTKDYYGNGILNAKELLKSKYAPSKINAEIKNKHKQEKANKQRGHSKFALLHLYSKRGSTERNTIKKTKSQNEKLSLLVNEMFASEVHQLVYIDPALHVFQDLDLDSETFNLDNHPDLLRAVAQSEFASLRLRSALKENELNNADIELNIDKRLDDHIIESEMGYTKVRGKGLSINVYNKKSYFEGEDQGAFVVDEFELKILDSERNIRAGAQLEIEASGNDLEGELQEDIQSMILVETFYEDTSIISLKIEEKSKSNKSRGGDLSASKNDRFIIPYEGLKDRKLGKKVLKKLVKVVKWIKPKIDLSKGKKLTNTLVETIGDSRYEVLLFNSHTPAKRNRNNWKEPTKAQWDEIKKSKNEILIFLPGLMSTVQGGFKEFIRNKEVIKKLQSKKYCKYVIGLNMPTVLHGIEKNAQFFDKIFKDQGFRKKKCTVLARSRGSLVARHLFEIDWLDNRTQKPLANAPFVLNKLLMTGPPNQGTRIASIDLRESLYNTMLNFARISLNKSITMLPGVVTAVKAGKAGITNLPGINDLEEGSDIITALNETEANRNKYWVVTTNYEPNGLITKLLDEGIIDRGIFKGQSNDLITPCQGAIFQNDDFPTSIVLKDSQYEVRMDKPSHFGYLKAKYDIVDSVLKLL